MREVYKLTKAEGYPRLLSRLHVHNIAFQVCLDFIIFESRKYFYGSSFYFLECTKYCRNVYVGIILILEIQAIMVRREAKWRKTMTATAISSLTAHRHVCQNEEIKLENSKLLMDESFR